jgi:antitoxin ParD1/3/4
MSARRRRSVLTLDARQDLSDILVYTEQIASAILDDKETHPLSVILNPQLEELVRQKVDAGLYGDADEVLTEALQLLDQRDQLRRLRATLAEADEQIDRGQGIPFTREAFDRIKLNARTKFETGHQPNVDVLP